MGNSQGVYDSEIAWTRVSLLYCKNLPKSTLKIHAFRMKTQNALKDHFYSNKIVEERVLDRFQ